MSKCKYTTIGGQAVLEGIMMKGPKVSCLSVRGEDGIIQSKVSANKSIKDKYTILKLPILRGVVTFAETLMMGYGSLMESAQIAGIEMDEESKFERWLDKKFGDNITKVITVIAAVLGVILALLLFTALPTFFVGLLRGFLPAPVCTILEGVIKIIIFVLYLYFVSRMKDIRRVFEYHGAEHKTIFCYESGKELTVENVRGFRRFHPRCGTSFLLIVLVIGILVFSMVSWDSIWMRVLLKIIMLPLVVGISYEIIKLAGKYNNVFTRAISAPGMWLQRLTTCEPDDSQIEVAIDAMLKVIPEDGESFEC